MNISLTLTQAAEKRLAARAAQEGKTLQELVQDVVEREALTDNGSELAGTTSPTSDQGAGPSQVEQETLEDDDDARPWRGVFAPGHDRKTLFTTEMQFRIDDLPRREPHVTISPRWIDDDE